MWEKFKESIASNIATVIAVGVVYNSARIALGERYWELASLRVLGFTRGEVSTFLLGELALEIAAAALACCQAVALVLRCQTPSLGAHRKPLLFM